MKQPRILIPTTLAILAVHLAAAATAGQLDIWTWRNPVPTGNQLNSVTYGESRFVAVGADGTIVTSANGGITWDQQVVPPDLSLSGVVYSPDLSMFVAVGSDSVTNNVILTSPDGINWTQATQAGGFGSGGLYAVAYGYTNFVAVGAGGVTWHSPGGSTWYQGSTPLGTTNLNGVAYGTPNTTPIFVAVGANHSIIYSANYGQTWTASSLDKDNVDSFNGIAYGNNIFVAVGDFSGFYVSPDGETFIPTSNVSPSGSSLYGDSVIFANNEFIVANTITYYPSILTSPDGISWTAYDEPPWLFSSIAYGSGIFVGVGSGSVLALNFLDITKAGDWDSMVTNVTQTALNAIIYGATTNRTSLFVGGGGGYGGYPTVVTSPDGYSWQLDRDSSLSSFLLANSSITSLANGNNTFVATINSAAGYTPGVSGAIISSSDGIHWMMNLECGKVLNGIAYGSGKFVAVGTSGTNVSSSDLIHWAPGSGLPSALSFNGVAWGNPNGTTTFVAVGEGPVGWGGQVIYHSNDGGLTWTPASFGPPSSEYFYGVTFGNGQFVAVGLDNSEPTPVGVIYTSSDGGTNWNQILQTSYTFAPSESDPPPFSGVTFGNGQFVAVTSSYVINNNETSEDGTGAQIFVSVDGINWIQSSVAAQDSLTAVASGSGQFIAVGGGGAILGSVLRAITGGSFDSSSGCFSFMVSGPPGTCGVYQSNDLSKPLPWNFLGSVTFTATMNSILFQDCNASNSISGYYYLVPAHPPGG
jgi:hypothetical protein